jgi:F0F1-type ATP synthase epsilon subunit
MPTIDILFGLTAKIQNIIEGKIVLSIIDDNFATTNCLTVRDKNGKLKGYLDFSVAGFGEIRPLEVTLLNDSSISFQSFQENENDTFLYSKKEELFSSKRTKRKYKALTNLLFQASTNNK